MDHEDFFRLLALWRTLGLAEFRRIRAVEREQERLYFGDEGRAA